MLRFYHIILFLLFLPFEGFSQSPDLAFVYFGEHQVSDIDSAVSNPEAVAALYIECDSSIVKYLNKLNENAQRFINLSQLTFSSECVFDTIPDWIFQLPKLNTLVLHGSASIYDIPNYYRCKLTKLSLSSPDNVVYSKWQKKIYMLRSLKVLQIEFSKPTEIDKDISNLNKLESLKLFAMGDITYPSSFVKMQSLKVFSIEQCLQCKSFPAVLPESIEYLSIRYTKVKRLSNNMSSLKKLKILDLSNSQIETFPEDFNFSQLSYFAAPKDLFTDEKWQAINKMVKRVVIGGDRTAKPEKSLYEKRN